MGGRETFQMIGEKKEGMCVCVDNDLYVVNNLDDVYAVCVVCVCDLEVKRGDVEEGRNNVHDVHDVHVVCAVCDVIVGQREGKNDFVCAAKGREARFPIPTVYCVLVALTQKRIIMARTRSGV